MPGTIFVSHASQDRDVATTLKHSLEAELLGGVSCFVSSTRDSIPPGSQWFERIRSAIQGCTLMIIVASPASVNRPWVNFEAGAACFRGIPVVPFCVRGQKKDQLPLPLSSFQALQADVPEDLAVLIECVAKAVHLRVTRIDESTARLSEALSNHRHSDNPPSIVEPAEPTPGRIEVKSDLPEPEYRESTVLFDRRVASAFPGVRGLKWYSGSEAVSRLERLLRPPLEFKGEHGGRYSPIMWLRGLRNLHVYSFGVLDRKGDKCLLGWDELIVNRIAVFKSNDYQRDFVYVEARPDKPTGVLVTTSDHISQMVSDFGFAWEEVGLYGHRYIKPTELDDGFAELDGQIVELEGATVRCRYLSPYNLILAPLASPLNDSKLDFKLDAMMRGILDRTNSIDDLVNWMEELPRNQRVME